MFGKLCGLCATSKLVVAVLFISLSSHVHADRALSYRGEVGSFTNDYFGDGHDRWRSGSYQKSYYSQGHQYVWGAGVELRARAEIVTPWVSSQQSGGDVHYSTLLGIGGFAHSNFVGFETRVGGEVLLLGDASGMEAIQSGFHDGLGMDASFDPSRDDIDRVENGVALRFDAEVARSIRVSGSSMIRPYVGLTFGADQIAAAGADIVIGPLASAEIWTRDVVTGRLLTPQVSQISGLSVVAGWDALEVETSIHFPESSGAELESTQYRSRLGIQSSTSFANFFIGQAWLSPNFVDQAEPQRVGMLSISFIF